MLALVHRQAHKYTRRLDIITNWNSQRCISSSKDEMKGALRRLLRETAQPVAVVTSHYPFDGLSDDDADVDSGELLREKEQHHSRHWKKFHGATLSSFTSIALDPDPLVAFSLRIPSRMAISLKERLSKDHSRSHSHPSSTTTNTTKANLVINLLSSTQSSTAHHFARADLFPHPFRITPYTLSEESLPVLNDSLGAISCELISCTPLHNLCHESSSEDTEKVAGVISELFISRVVRVEKVGVLSSESGSSGEVSPLIYYRKKYGTVLPH